MSMPKPRTLKVKAKVKRVIVARTPKPRPFDLSAGISDVEKQRQMLALQALLDSEGWMLLEQTLTTHIELLDRQIIEKQTIDGEPLDDKTCDRMRDERSAMDMLRKKPRALLDRFTRVEPPEPDDDPYDR